MLVACRRPQKLVKQLQLWGLIQSSLGLYFLIDAHFQCFLQISVFPIPVQNIKKPINKLFIFWFIRCCGTGQSVLVSLCLPRCMFCCFHSAHPLWPGVQRGCSERCVSHQVRQDAHWLLAADRSHPGQSAVGELTFSLAPWPWWEVKCVAGSSQHWHSRTRRRNERRRRRRRKRTGPEGERFSWPVTPVPILLSTPLRLESWQPLLAGLHRVSHARTLSRLLLQSQK